MDLVMRRGGFVEGVGTWIGKDRNHWFVRLSTTHKANGSNVALITPTLIFQKLGKIGFCTCHLEESITQHCMAVVMQTRYQLKAEELLLDTISYTLLVHGIQEISTFWFHIPWGRRPNGIWNQNVDISRIPWEQAGCNDFISLSVHI